MRRKRSSTNALSHAVLVAATGLLVLTLPTGVLSRRLFEGNGVAKIPADSGELTEPALLDAAAAALITPAPVAVIAKVRREDVDSLDVDYGQAAFGPGPGPGPGPPRPRPPSQQQPQQPPPPLRGPEDQIVMSLSSALLAAQRNLSQASQTFEQSISELQGSLSSATSAAQAASSNAAEASTSAASVAASASTAVAVARASISNIQAAASQSLADAESRAKLAQASANSAEADARQARAEADSRVSQAQGASVSITQAAIAVVASVLGSALITLIVLWLLMRYRRKKRLEKVAEEEEKEQIALAAEKQRLAAEEARRRGLERGAAAMLMHSRQRNTGSFQSRNRPSSTGAGGPSRNSVASRRGSVVGQRGPGSGNGKGGPSTRPQSASTMASSSSRTYVSDHPISFPRGAVLSFPPGSRNRDSFSSEQGMVGYAMSTKSDHTSSRPVTADMSAAQGAGRFNLALGSHPVGGAPSSNSDMNRTSVYSPNLGSDRSRPTSRAPFFQQRLGRLDEEDLPRTSLDRQRSLRRAGDETAATGSKETEETRARRMEGTKQGKQGKQDKTQVKTQVKSDGEKHKGRNER
ncbi:hypothetical protein MCOR29_011426 [Pyricularia oryzae]|uniref:Uncharacterized protein n=2 Tax=Pyricularia TaxID=48558 RepID=A0ABQ8N366_PYRGI|nr:hypothetical protein MCOR26_011447 [Pyricularia oryzae]KAI6290489.1 hypothetical protein MCOR33_011259 [Pyricularia grisea]KAI6295177.1 hypothetical protein MCOR29_011426 [Pyricularia oryzae]KAI6409342.1 hypothetical protein MCOR23_001029 [Pyricularia oryzae]KAI6416210.1 hypothetical protein MCOR21_011308 [Pyricularia oryzae]